MNAKSTSAGFSRDPLSKWACVGRLKAVNYDGEGIRTEMVVACPAGETVRLRNGPNGAVIEKIPAGETVSAEDVGNSDWLRVTWQGKTGYMMRKYLHEVTSDANDDTVTVTLDRNAAELLRDALIEALGAG